MQVKAVCDVLKPVIETLENPRKVLKKNCLKFVITTSGNTFAFKTHVCYAGYKCHWQESVSHYEKRKTYAALNIQQSYHCMIIHFHAEQIEKTNAVNVEF